MFKSEVFNLRYKFDKVVVVFLVWVLYGVMYVVQFDVVVGGSI